MYESFSFKKKSFSLESSIAEILGASRWGPENWHAHSNCFSLAMSVLNFLMFDKSTQKFLPGYTRGPGLF